MKIILFLLAFLPSFLYANSILDDGHPSQDQVEKTLKQLALRTPQLMKLESIGKSVQGREIWVVRLHDRAHAAPYSRVALIAGIHGDEIVGRELLMRFLPDLLAAYRSDPRTKELLQKSEVVLVPCLNPDGCQNKWRTNAQGLDLNRAFPDVTFDGLANQQDGRPPEVVAWMKFQEENPIAMSLTYHGGEIPTVNYPWDNSGETFGLQNLARTLSLEYAALNPSMRVNSQFPGGAAHGHSWYSITGGMQDWSLLHYNNLQLTVEVSLLEWPAYEMMSDFYSKNQSSMMQFLSRLGQAVGFYYSRPDISGNVVFKRLGDEKVFGPFKFFRSQLYQILEPGLYKAVIDDNKGQQYTWDMEVVANQAIPEWHVIP